MNNIDCLKAYANNMKGIQVMATISSVIAFHKYIFTG